MAAGIAGAIAPSAFMSASLVLTTSKLFCFRPLESSMLNTPLPAVFSAAVIMITIVLRSNAKQWAVHHRRAVAALGLAMSIAACAQEAHQHAGPAASGPTPTTFVAGRA